MTNTETPAAEDRTALALYRLYRAKIMIKAAQNAIDIDFATSVNRSYYAIFHSIRAVLALDGKSFRKHSAVIAEWNKSYVREGLFPSNFGRIAQKAFTERNHCDYVDFYTVSNEETAELLKSARTLTAAVEQYINSTTTHP